jgi:23S rRNA (cytosine1962-C5)-methyltransferase
MLLLTPTHWRDYELIDSGHGEKLERFGDHVLRRPEPQAVWSPTADPGLWEQVQARYLPDGSHSGNWERAREMPDQWYVQYRYRDMHLRFRLGLTGFKHVGIFPEQAANWEYIYDAVQALPGAKRVLNLFAYTGGASLAARAAGADVVHCDSIKNVLSWANANQQASQLGDIRWLLEDAFKFVKREAKRGRQYEGIILDPPAYGHGPKGEKWQLEDMVNELVESVAKILAPEASFLVFNSYSLGFSSLVLQNLVWTHFGPEALAQGEGGELYLPERSGRRLPMGIFFRFHRGKPA